MLKEKISKQFKKDLKKISNNKKLLIEIFFVIEELKNGKKLDKKYLDHKLSGNLKNQRECHIRPDRLLVYQINGDELILTLTRTGKHSEVFEK